MKPSLVGPPTIAPGSDKPQTLKEAVDASQQTEGARLSAHLTCRTPLHRRVVDHALRRDRDARAPTTTIQQIREILTHMPPTKPTHTAGLVVRAMVCQPALPGPAGVRGRLRTDRIQALRAADQWQVLREPPPGN